MLISKKQTIVLESRVTDNHISQMSLDLQRQVNLVLDIRYVILLEQLILNTYTNYIIASDC